MLAATSPAGVFNGTVRPSGTLSSLGTVKVKLSPAQWPSVRAPAKFTVNCSQTRTSLVLDSVTFIGSVTGDGVQLAAALTALVADGVALVVADAAAGVDDVVALAVLSADAVGVAPKADGSDVALAKPRTVTVARPAEVRMADFIIELFPLVVCIPPDARLPPWLPITPR